MTNDELSSAFELYPSMVELSSSTRLPPANDNRRRRAAIYARFSALGSRGTNRDSSQHQILVCKEYAASINADVTEVYFDDNQTGVAVANRGDFQRLLRDSERDIFDILIMTDMSRAGRHVGQLAPHISNIFERGIRMHVVGYGEVNQEAAISMVSHAEGGAKYARTATRVGKRERAKKGISMSMAPFGYRKDRDHPSGLVKDEEMAAEVVRIVDRVLAGGSPRQICQDLNERNVPRPMEGVWAENLLIGTPQRPGVCRHPLLAGKMIYGRTTTRINPETGKTVRTRVPPEKWVVADVPHLAIIGMERFLELQQLLDRRAAAAPKKSPGPKALLSGKFRCVGCGNRMNSRGGSSLGGHRVACRVAQLHHTCSLTNEIPRDPVEALILNHIQGIVSSGDLEREAREEYVRQREIRQEVHGADLREARRKLSKNDDQIRRLVDLALQDAMPSRVIRERMTSLENDRETLQAEVKRLEYAQADLIEEISSLERVREGLSDIGRVLEEGRRGPDIGTEVAETIRALIDDIWITAKYDRFEVRVTGLAGFEAEIKRVGRGRPRKRKVA